MIADANVLLPVKEKTIVRLAMLFVFTFCPHAAILLQNKVKTLKLLKKICFGAILPLLI